MQRVENPELRRRILNHLAAQYNIYQTREPNHLSSYIYCRTKAYLDQHQAIKPTDAEVLLFSTGYALQAVITPENCGEGEYRKHGVIYRPDMEILAIPDDPSAGLGEVKTTRKRAKNHTGSLPDTWLSYMKGGCYITGTNTYQLAVLYLNDVPPELLCDTITFTDEELGINWDMIQDNKEVLDKAIITPTPPKPFENCYSWECKLCRYKLVCEVIVSNG